MRKTISMILFNMTKRCRLLTIRSFSMTSFLIFSVSTAVTFNVGITGRLVAAAPASVGPPFDPVMEPFSGETTSEALTLSPSTLISGLVVSGLGASGLATSVLTVSGLLCGLALSCLGAEVAFEATDGVALAMEGLTDPLTAAEETEGESEGDGLLLLPFVVDVRRRS